MSLTSQAVRTLLTVFAGALMGGLAAVGWAIGVDQTGHEIGFVAIGVGFVTGFCVFWAAIIFHPDWLMTMLGFRLVIPLLAVLLASGAVVLGKYLAFAFVAQDLLPDVSVVSGETWDLFVDAGDAVWGGYDILWFVLAALAAIRGALHSLPSGAATNQTSPS